MCGGAIISDYVPRRKSSSRRLTASSSHLRDVAANIFGSTLSQKNNNNVVVVQKSNGYSTGVKSEVIDLDHESETDFLDFKEDYVQLDDIKPFNNLHSGVQGSIKSSLLFLFLCSSMFSQISVRDFVGFFLFLTPFLFCVLEGQTRNPVQFRKKAECSVFVDLEESKPICPNVGLNSSDQGSSSFCNDDISDFEWGEKCVEIPEISSFLSAAAMDDHEEEAQSLEEDDGFLNLAKRTKASPADHQIDELSAFESELEFFKNPFPEGNWDLSLDDAFLSGDVRQNEGNQMDFWTFEDIYSTFGGV
ncbi:OLC1v1003719C1 [Oldenlandia corymbosa var. corymbosa]|uniref:OLC1v1003719C1 n=1 Tax=Oldenlandia corymbosa var. corymbosa TaxID=529605 RepID=A0AAV1DBG9_OLDCO|nr:OLC1v1003719C1 [Oldenlandia corymbosa var. corymbosa]